MFIELRCGFAGVAPGSVYGIRPFPPGTDSANPPSTPAGLRSPLRHRLLRCLLSAGVQGGLKQQSRCDIGDPEREDWTFHKVYAEKWLPGRGVHTAGPLPGRGSRFHLQPPGPPMLLVSHGGLWAA